MTGALGLAIGVVRVWTHAYTWRAPVAYRETRRAEIESDLWEFQQDSRDGGWAAAAHVLARLLAGIPDDLGWRIEHVSFERQSHRMALTLTVTAAAFLGAALWLVDLTAAGKLPIPPTPPTVHISLARLLAPPPPPPPPPPPRSRK